MKEEDLRNLTSKSIWFLANKGTRTLLRYARFATAHFSLFNERIPKNVFFVKKYVFRGFRSRWSRFWRQFSELRHLYQESEIRDFENILKRRNSIPLKSVRSQSVRYSQIRSQIQSEVSFHSLRLHVSKKSRKCH